jgi:hypothetical protein
MSDANKNNKMYVVDSGTTCHMTNMKTNFTHTKQYIQNIKTAKKNQSMIAKEIGDLEFKECNLKDISYVPELSRNYSRGHQLCSHLIVFQHFMEPKVHHRIHKSSSQIQSTSPIPPPRIHPNIIRPPISWASQ